MIKILKFIFVLIAIYSCNRIDGFDAKNTQILTDHKKNFPIESIKHFPHQIGQEVNIIYNEGLKNNNLNLYLVERNLSETDINRILSRLNGIKCHRGNDKRLLIINRNERKVEGFSEFPKIDSSNLQGETPIPNFIDYKNGIYSDPNYEFYIIHTDNKERQFKNETLGGNVSMPSVWKHGISYGVAVNRYEQNVIYWVAMW
jgi:hypothetical protein